jgi:hypothetical protein
MGAEDGAGVLGQCVGVVRPPRPVRRPHLDEPRAGLPDHVRDAEAAADLDKLAAGDHDLLAGPGQRGGGEQHRSGAVVDGERGLGAGELGEEVLRVSVARAAGAGLRVPLEVGIALRRSGDRVARRFGERRAAEVGVDDHAGGVDHAAQRRLLRAGEALARTGHEIRIVLRARLELLAPLLDRGSRRRDGQRVRCVEFLRELADRREGPKTGHRGEGYAALGQVSSRGCDGSVPSLLREPANGGW